MAPAGAARVELALACPQATREAAGRAARRRSRPRAPRGAPRPTAAWPARSPGRAARAPAKSAGQAPRPQGARRRRARPACAGTLSARRRTRACSWPARLRTSDSSGERSSAGTRSRTSVDILRSRSSRPRHASPATAPERRTMRASPFLPRGAPSAAAGSAEEPRQVGGREGRPGPGLADVDLDPLRGRAPELEVDDARSRAGDGDRARARGRPPGRAA